MFSDHNNSNANHNTTAYHTTTAAMGRPPGEPLGMLVAAVGFPSQAGAGTRVPATRFALLVQKCSLTGTKVRALWACSSPRWDFRAKQRRAGTRVCVCRYVCVCAAVGFPSETEARRYVCVCVYRMVSADVARVQDGGIVRTYEALLVQRREY